MYLSTFFVFISLSSLSASEVSLTGRLEEICNLHESVFDRGLRKLLDSDRFFKIDLPDFLHNVDYNLLNVRVGFFDGTLRGISTIRRRGKGTLQVDEYGNSRLTFHVAGGPLEADYTAGIRAWFLRTALDVRVRVPRFQASFTIRESSPNDLSVEVHGVRMSKGSLIFDEDDISLEGPIYDIVFEEFRPLIQQKVGESLVRELRKLAEETLGAVKLYAVSNAQRTVRGEDSLALRAWKHGFNAATSLSALIEGGRSHRRRTNAHSGSTSTIGQRLDSYRVRRQRQMGVFERCLRTLVVSTGFEPATLPDDLGAFNYSTALVNEIDGNVTGLSSISLNGASWMSVDECGIRARFDLVFKGLRVNATASARKWSMSRSVAFVMEIPEVEVLLEIQETEDSLQITTYDVTFTFNVTVTPTMAGTVGWLVDLFGGLSNTTLEDNDLQLIKSSSRRYVQRIVDAVKGFIADPPPIPTAQRQG